MSFGVNMNQNSSQWRGVPLTEIYGSQTPWGAPEFPLIVPSFNHTVLYHISSGSNEIGERPPKPQIAHDKWDHNYVRMPCSSQSLYPIEDNGSTSLKKRWEIIEECLQKPIENSEQLADTIISYNTKFKKVWKFHALHKLFNQYLEEEESQFFFTVTLPEIAKLALALPKLIQSPIPLLIQHKNRAISLSQQQISSLLANAFFCTFPRRNTAKSTSEYASYPHINFITLYESSGSDAVLEKLKCICHYFRRVCTKVPVGVMTFMRRSVPPRQCPDWLNSSRLVAGTPLHVNSTGTIEDDGVGLIQIDFANKYLGGGVLNRGCVQEEIRFVICPELLVSMLFTEVLRPNEALIMIGCERFSKYTGYGHTFQWAGDYADGTPFDSSGRRRCAVLAIDALPFSSKSHEYKQEFIVREMNKAWVGVSTFSSEEQQCLQYPGIATGNWGCGAFGGSADLKSLLQLMATTEARRPMAYYSFGDVELRNNIVNMYNLLARHNVTVGQLFQIITMFAQTDVRKSQLYPFIHQSLIDHRKPNTNDAMDTSPSAVSNTVEKELNNSPDLFSQDFDGSFSETNTGCTNTPVCNSKNNTIIVQATERRGQVATESKTLKLDEETRCRNEISLDTSVQENIRHKSRLIEAMQQYDGESGKVDYNIPQNSVLNKVRVESSDSVDSTQMLSEIRKPEVNIEDSNRSRNELDSLVQESSAENEDLPMNVSPDLKKKISRKITDYFNRKT